MSAYNFPNSPSNGDTVNVAGIIYTYDSTDNAWKTGAGQSPAILSNGTTPSLASGITAAEIRTLIDASADPVDLSSVAQNIIPDADFKFYITANVKTRALRRFKELKRLKKKITYQEVLKSIKKRDKSDFSRKISPLKKTKDSLLINTTNLNKRACFLKIKKIIDRKLNY